MHPREDQARQSGVKRHPGAGAVGSEGVVTEKKSFLQKYISIFLLKIMACMW